MDAFDADALIYAAIPGHPLGRRIAALFPAGPVSGSGGRAGVGSVLLLPEVLAKPLKDGELAALKTLSGFLARLDLRPVDRATAQLATVLGARYNLRAADAVHLATAVAMGARRFITSNSRDFGAAIKEIDITFPADLAEPAALRPSSARAGMRHAPRVPPARALAVALLAEVDHRLLRCSPRPDATTLAVRNRRCPQSAP